MVRLVSEDSRKGPKAMIEAKAHLNMLIGSIDNYIVEFPVTFEEAISSGKQMASSIGQLTTSEIESGDAIVSACNLIKKQYDVLIKLCLSTLERVSETDVALFKNVLKHVGTELLQFVDAIRRCRGQNDKSDLALASDKIEEAVYF